jgi:hypothetical protein
VIKVSLAERFATPGGVDEALARDAHAPGHQIADADLLGERDLEALLGLGAREARAVVILGIRAGGGSEGDDEEEDGDREDGDGRRESTGRGDHSGEDGAAGHG